METTNKISEDIIMHINEMPKEEKEKLNPLIHNLSHSPSTNIVLYRRKCNYSYYNSLYTRSIKFYKPISKMY